MRRTKHIKTAHVHWTCGQMTAARVP